MCSSDLFWGPLRHVVQGPAREAMDRENRNDIIAVPFTLLWQVTLFFWPMLLVIKAYTAFMWTFGLFVIGATGMYLFWWRPLRQRERQDLAAGTAAEPAPERYGYIAPALVEALAAADQVKKAASADLTGAGTILLVEDEEEIGRAHV